MWAERPLVYVHIAFALSERSFLPSIYPQGDALGCEITGLSGRFCWQTYTFKQKCFLRWAMNRPLFSVPSFLHCSVLSSLLCPFFTALFFLHCSVLSLLLCPFFTALFFLHCSVLSLLLCSFFTALSFLHCSVLSSLLCTFFTALSFLYCSAPCSCGFATGLAGIFGGCRMRGALSHEV